MTKQSIGIYLFDNKRLDMNSDQDQLAEYRRRRALEFEAKRAADARAQSEIDEQKRLEDEAKREEELEQERRLAEKVKQAQEDLNALTDLENVIVEHIMYVIDSDTIFGVDFLIRDLTDKISSKLDLVTQLDQIEKILGHIHDLITAINNNPNTEFRVTDTNANHAHYSIVNNIKTIIELLGGDLSAIDFNVMDTTEDADIAARLQIEAYADAASDVLTRGDPYDNQEWNY